MVHIRRHFEQVLDENRPMAEHGIMEIQHLNAYTRWDNMMRYLEDGRLLLDKGERSAMLIASWRVYLVENEIRPITLGRKNYLFCGNHEAAQNMAVVCSLLATCRNHDVNPGGFPQ